MSALSLAFLIPGRPVGKGRPRFSRRSGAAYTPQATATYENWVTLCASQVMRGREQFTGPLAVEIVATFAPAASWSRKRREAALSGEAWPTGRPDLDNIAKAVTDGCNGIVWRDDAQIVHVTAEKHYGAEESVAVHVSELGATTVRYVTHDRAEAAQADGWDVQPLDCHHGRHARLAVRGR